MINADTDPPSVRRLVIDPVRDPLAQFFILEIIYIDQFRRSLGLPFRTGVLEIPDQLLLLGVHRDHGLIPLLELGHLSVDVFKLGIAVRVRLALARLAVGLQAVVELMEQVSHGPLTDLIAILPELLGQFPGTLAGPPQGRHGIAAGGRVHEQFERGEQSRILFDESFPPGPRTATPLHGECASGRLTLVLNLLNGVADGGPGHPGRLCQCGDPTMAQAHGFGRGPKPSYPLIEEGLEGFVLRPERGDDACVFHTPTEPKPVRNNQLIFSRLLRDAAPLPPRPVLGPRLGEVEPDIDQGMLMMRSIGHVDSDLAVVHLAEPTKPLPRHARRRLALLGEPRGVEDDHAVGGADRAAHLAGQFAQQGSVLPGGRADEVREAVPLLTVPVGDRLGGLVLEVGDKPGEVGAGVVPLFPASQALGERPGELGEAFDAALEDLRRDLALVEQLWLTVPVTPMHRSPPGGLTLAGRHFYITPWSLSTEFRQPNY